MPDLTCREFIQFLDDYFSGTQTTEVRSRFESHLNACNRCREYLHTYRQTIELSQAACQGLDDALPADVPPDLITAVLEAVSRNR